MNELTGALIKKARTGDQDAITQLYVLTYSSVYKTVKAMIAQEDTVLDIVQDSCIKGFQSLDQLENPQQYPAWMKRIATNKARDYLKKKRPVLFTELSSEEGEEIDFRDEQLEHCPQEVLDQKETTRLMGEILSTLSEDQRLVIGMYYYEQMSVREIAESLDCSENTVKSRLNYGRKKIEAKVLELEKKGTKLYSLAPVPFLLWLFRMDAADFETPSAAVFQNIAAQLTTAPTGPAGVSGAAPVAGAGKAAGAGVKALAVKIAAGVAAAAVVCAGALFAVNSGDGAQEASSQPAGGTSASEAADPAAQQAYEEILNSYIASANADSQSFLEMPDNYFHGDYAVLCYYHMDYSVNFYSACLDLDGDGTEELLVGCGQEDYIQIIDLYGFDGVQAVQLLYEPTLGDRSSLTLLEDGTLCLVAGSGAEQTSTAYFGVEGCALVEVKASNAAQVNQIPWRQLEIQAPQGSNNFDSILADIQEVLSIPDQDYEADPETYDVQYSHLGNGMVWSLRHRNSGIYTMCIWNALFDIDGDGQEELCIGRGVDAAGASPIAIYWPDGKAVCDDSINDYLRPYDFVLPVDWQYLGG